MATEIGQRIHIISLVLNRKRDIPKIRSKAKSLAREAGYERIAMVQIATAASETARILVNSFGGGTVEMSFVQRAAAPHDTGVELLFTGKMDTGACDAATRNLCGIFPYSGLSRVLDEVEAQMSGANETFRLRLIKWGLKTPWDALAEGSDLIRQDLFLDAEESYLENLRAKHEEVLRLLKEKADKNNELTRVNTQLLRLTEDLEALAQERTVFEMTLKIADRVRNPAMVIGGLARAIRKEIPESAWVWEKLEAIVEQAGRLNEIVKEFETLAAAQSGLFAHVDLGSMVREIMETWIPSLYKKGITHEIRTDEGPILVRSNPRTFKVALLHVLRNAVHASPSNGTISVQVTRSDGNPVVIVRDHGPGIPDEVRARLFKASVTTKPTGTGLGLILVKQIMREHQGDIEIESKPGQGTTVRLRFPARWREAGQTPGPVS